MSATSISLDSKKSRLIIVVILGLIIVGWLWWQFGYNNPSNVFNDMLSNNLSTNGVVKHSVQNQDSSSADQLTQLNLGAPNLSHNIITLSQKDPTGSSFVVTEGLGTVTKDYNRYLAINTSQKGSDGKALDFSKITGVWGVANDATGQTVIPQYLTQAMFGIVPFANLTGQSKQSVLNFIRDKQVYKVNYDDVATKKVDGRSAFVFKVELKPSAYIELLQKLVVASGLPDQPDLDPTAYAQSANVKLTLSVDKKSHQLIKIHFDDTNQDEQYQSYGIKSRLSPPSNAIPQSELQKQVQAIQ